MLYNTEISDKSNNIFDTKGFEVVQQQSSRSQYPVQCKMFIEITTTTNYSFRIRCPVEYIRVWVEAIWRIFNIWKSRFVSNWVRKLYQLLLVHFYHHGDCRVWWLLSQNFAWEDDRADCGCKWNHINLIAHRIFECLLDNAD